MRGTNAQHLWLFSLHERSNKAGYSLRHFNSTLYLLSSPHRRQYRGGDEFSLPCSLLVSSPHRNITGRRPAVLLFIFYFLFCLPPPHRRHYRRGGIVLLHLLRWYLLLAGTLPGGGQLCFSSTLLRCLTRGTNAQPFWLSLCIGANVLGHEQQYTCFNSACRTVPREHFNANGNLATFEGQPATGNGFVRTDVDAKVSTSMLVVISLRTHRRSPTSASPSWTLCWPLFPRRCVNGATSDSLAQAISGAGTNTSSPFCLPTFSRESFDLDTVLGTPIFLVAVHERGRECQCIRDILFCSSKLTSSQYVNT